MSWTALAGRSRSEFSPRYERHRDDLVSIDVSGLERLLGPPRTIGEELRREAAARGVRRARGGRRGRGSAALVLALARPGLTVVEPGGEARGARAAPDRDSRKDSTDSGSRLSARADCGFRLATLRPC